MCAEAWGDDSFPLIEQKMIDARTALADFAMYEAEPQQKPTPENLSRFFQALYERDRRIVVNGTEIPQQHIDAYVLLHNPEYERICWDSANQDLALMLCDHLNVQVSIAEIEQENIRFQQRSGIETLVDFTNFLSANGWSKHEYDRLMIQNARIRKLQHSNTVSRMYRRNTQQIIDYSENASSVRLLGKVGCGGGKTDQEQRSGRLAGSQLGNPSFHLTGTTHGTGGIGT